MIRQFTQSTLLFLSVLGFHCLNAQVGINETVPEQQLHLGSQTGTIRVDGLNGTNNEYNGNQTSKTYPLYVDSNGDLTLEVTGFQNNDGNDSWTTTGVNGSVTIVSGGVNDGYEYEEILAIPITVNRNVIVELKYSLSMDVFKNTSLEIIRDSYARNITNFFTVNSSTLTPTTRRYGQASKCYFNKNDYREATSGSYSNTPITGSVANAATGYIYNSGTTYIPLGPGNHVLRLYGSVSSGSSNQPTHVRFAGGPDSVFVRLY